MYKEIQYLKVVRVALITAPLFGLFGATPVFVFAKIELSRIMMGFLVITSTALFLWSVNIALLWLSNRFDFKGKDWLRYIVSATICVLVMYAVSRQALLTSGEKIPLELPKNLPLGVTPSRTFLLAFLQSQSINIIIIVLMELLLLRERKQQVETENTQLRMANLEAKHSQLKQQLHPHFLFNSLNALRSLIKRSPEQAEEYLVKLSELLRFSINSNSQTLVGLAEELELSTNYLHMQQVRFGRALKFTIDIPYSMQVKGKMPVYSIQLLVENAIKHNVLTITQPLHVGIKGDTQTQTVTVTNNLRPKLNMEESSGLGLSNLAERYRLLNNEQVAISRVNGEFTVTIKVLEYESGNH